MPKSPELIELSCEEVLRRSKAVTAAVKELLVSKNELVDITLDSLINAYAQVANESGRLAETPAVLRMVATRLENIAASRPPIH